MSIVETRVSITNLYSSGIMSSLDKIVNLTPGPVSVDKRVLNAMSIQPPSHLSSVFPRVMESITDMSRGVFATSGEVMVLGGGGTLAVNAMVYSMVNPGDNVLLLDTGFFGRRLYDALVSRGAHVDLYPVDFNDRNYCSSVRGFIEDKHSSYKVLATVYTETSLGATLRCLEKIVLTAKSHDLTVLVDGVSAIGGEPFYMDKWGVDAAATCSQKCLEAPPGASLVAVNADALRILRRTRDKPPYLDLLRYMNAYHAKRRTPSTPPTNILLALLVALEILYEEGLSNRWARYRENTRWLRWSLRELGGYGVKPVVSDASASNTVTAIWINNALRVKRILEEEYGLLVATGLDDYSDKMLRIGVMGQISRGELRRLADALREVLGEKILV